MSSLGMGTIPAISMFPSSTMTTGVATAGTHVATAIGTAALGSLAMAAMAGAMAVGAGIVIAEGLMWCGEKMQANYQQACQEWTAFENQARTASRADVEQVNTYLVSQLEFLSIDEFAHPDHDGATAVNQQALEQAIARARNILADTTLIEQDKSAIEQKILSARLRAEIKTGRGLLPATTITAAEQALGGSSGEMRAMLEHLDLAWNAIQEQPVQQTRAIQRTQQLLTLVSSRLRAIETMLRDMNQETAQAYQKRVREIDNQLQDARDELVDMRPEHALNAVTSSQQAADRLLEEVTGSAHQSWNELRTRVNEQIGTLDALWKMLVETEAVQIQGAGPLCNQQKATDLKQRLETQIQKARSLLQGNNPQSRRDLGRLTVAVENLKQAVFTTVKAGQQQTIGTLIQSTLSELGYQSDAGEQPVVKVHGDITRVEVMASRTNIPGQRDDKVISFDVSRDGQVSYDFGGYIGEECVKEAQEVFEALHKKGVYLVNETALPLIQHLPLERIMQEVLDKPAFHTAAVKNKTQAELAETLKGVLNKMGYPGVRVSSVGGSIELEAFEGNIGYRVVMSPEGEVQIFKDAAQNEVTHDTKDRLAQASRTVQETSAEPEIKQRKKSYMGSRKGQMLTH